MNPMQSTTRQLLTGMLFAVAVSAAHAAGMQPESTVVLINEADGEATMVVTNTDPGVALMYAKIEAVPEDPNPPVVLTPPVARVDSGKRQTVRFLLTNKAPLAVERYARVRFDGIPERKNEGKNTVTLTVRQDLPVVIHPKSLAEDRAPWTHLKWTIHDGTLTVVNDSPYVVRLDQGIRLLPGDVEASLAKSYLVPGGKAQIALDAGKAARDFKQVQIRPFTAYGYAMPPYTAAIGVAPAVASQ